MITATSRYTQSVATVDDTYVQVAVRKQPYFAKRTMSIITNEGDTFDKIAGRILKDSTQYWKIAGLNPHIRFPDVIPAGTLIVVPIV